jgi:hypothetical protein
MEVSNGGIIRWKTIDIRLSGFRLQASSFRLQTFTVTCGGKKDESFSTLSGLPAFTDLPVTYDSYQDSSLALRMTGVERRKNHSACFPDCRYLPAVLSLAILTKILRFRSE